jgi:cytochrome d ubiquinol oxidase subunit I
VWWFHRRLPRSRWFLPLASVSGLAAIAAMEMGWIVTEVGRQPWIVYHVLLTQNAVTPATAVPVTLGVILGFYAVVTVVTVGVPWRMGQRWRREDAELEEQESVPYGPPAGQVSSR